MWAGRGLAATGALADGAQVAAEGQATVLEITALELLAHAEFATRQIDHHERKAAADDGENECQGHHRLAFSELEAEADDHRAQDRHGHQQAARGAASDGDGGRLACAWQRARLVRQRRVGTAWGGRAPMVQLPHQNVAQHDAGREKQPQMEYGHLPWGSSGMGASDSRSRPVGTAWMGAAPVPTTVSKDQLTDLGSGGSDIAVPHSFITFHALSTYHRNGHTRVLREPRKEAPV